MGVRLGAWSDPARYSSERSMQSAAGRRCAEEHEAGNRPSAAGAAPGRGGQDPGRRDGPSQRAPTRSRTDPGPPIEIWPAPVHAVTAAGPQAAGEETGGARLRTLLLAQAGGPLLRVTGEIDHRSAAVLEDALRLPWAARSLHTVRVDLGGVSSCGSRGLAVLLAADQRARERGVKLLLLNVPPQMARLFAASGADEVLSVVDPVDVDGRRSTAGQDRLPTD